MALDAKAGRGIASLIASLAVTGPVASLTAYAQIVGVAVDADAQLIEGQVVPPRPAQPDIAVFFRVQGQNLVKLGEVEVPASFQGPPSSVVLSPDERYAFVSASTSRQAGQAVDVLVPLNVISVVDLSGAHPRVTKTLSLPAAPSSLALSPDGRVLLAFHGDADSVSALRVHGEELEVVQTVALPRASKPMAGVFLSDGLSVLVTLAGTNKIARMRVSDGRLERPFVEELSAGIYPAAICLVRGQRNGGGGKLWRGLG